MSRQEKEIFAQLQQSLNDMKNPATNPAQNYLTQQSLAGADYFNKGDFSQLPKGMYFDFKNPVDQMKQYDQAMDVGKEGTYALGDSEGAGKAMALAGDYRKNLFARDASQNYQDNIKQAAGNVQAGLGQSANYKTGQDQAVMSALQNMYQLAPKGFSWGNLVSGLVGAGGQVASAGLMRSGTPSVASIGSKMLLGGI